MGNIGLNILGAICLCLSGCVLGIVLVLSIQWYSRQHKQNKSDIVLQRESGETHQISGSTGWLIMNQGPGRGSSILVDQPVMGIGRDPRNAITVDHPQVSRFHARLTWDNANLYLEDSRSANGTYINQNRLQGRQKLENNDVIGLGLVVQMTFYQ